MRLGTSKAIAGRYPMEGFLRVHAEEEINLLLDAIRKFCYI